MSQVIWESDGSVFLKVVVRPKAKGGEFIGEVTDTEILVNLHSPAREGKANSELIKGLAKLLKLSSSSISIVAGQKSREKTLLLTGTTIDKVRDVLDVFHNG